MYNIALVFLSIAGTLAKENCREEQQEPWSYRGRNGPRFWGRRYPFCNDINQSPINIETEKLIVYNLAPISLKNYDKPVKNATIENDGHTVQVQFTDGTWRGYVVGNMNFTLNQLHFHWGNSKNRGSEHFINGTQFAMEMHLVHSSPESPGLDRIGVIGVIYRQSRKNLKGLDPIVKVLEEVKYKDSRSRLRENLNLSQLLPQLPFTYFRYQGSLTTPGCDQYVMWAIVNQVLSVGKDQLKEFRKLNSQTRNAGSGDNCLLVNNYRDIQPLMNRYVYVSY